jgi:hypothetical protein
VERVEATETGTDGTKHDAQTGRANFSLAEALCPTAKLNTVAADLKSLFLFDFFRFLLAGT